MSLPIVPLRMRNAAPLIRLGPSVITSTANGPSPFQAFLFGGLFTASQSFTANNVGAKAGDTGFSANMRVAAYNMSSGNLAGWGALNGGFSALQVRTGAANAPFSIVSGTQYGIWAMMDASGGWLATSGDAVQKHCGFASYGASPPATNAGWADDGFPQCSYCYITS